MATVRLTCPCGHAWDYAGNEPVPADLRQVCPVCTAASQNTVPTGQSALPKRTKSTSRHGSPGHHPMGSGTYIQSPTQQAKSAAESVAETPGRVVAGFEILEELNR